MNKNDQMNKNAGKATAFLKSVAHKHRLMILCHLCERPHSVGGLQALIPISQPGLSGHLKRMYDEGLLARRREGQKVYYSLKGTHTKKIIGTLYDIFCKDNAEQQTQI